MIKRTIILLWLMTFASGAAKPLNIDQHLTGQKRDSNQPDTNEIEKSDISASYGFGEMEIIKLDYGIQCLQIADFDGDGRNDIAIANNRKAAIDILIQKESPGPQEEEVAVDANDIDRNTLTGPSRFSKQTVPVSQRIYSLVCGDLNSDGLVDLAYYGEPRGLYILLQKPRQDKGKSKTLSWQPRKRIGIDDALPGVNALVCADINNDGKKDIIAAGRDAVYIVLQKEDGALGEPIKYATAARVLGVEVGDISGDGINDLLIATDDTDRPIHVRLGLKTGQLGPEIRLSVENPLALELAGLDGKAGQDIVTIDAVSRRLMCYKFASQLNSPKSTEGTQNDDWPVLFYPLTAGTGSDKRDLVIGDVDGDGLMDVVISDPGAAELIFYRQATGVGLAEPERFPSLAEADSLSIADIDGDGKNEVGVLSVKEKAIGISKFEAGRLSFPRAVDAVGEPVAMELADIDSDGAADCVYISRSQTDSRSFRVIFNVAKAQGETDVNAAWEMELKRLAANPQGIKVIDVDQDGLKDVLVFVKYELPILIRQTEKRKFEAVDSPKAQAGLIKEATPRSIAAADIDGQPGKSFLRHKIISQEVWFSKTGAGRFWTSITPKARRTGFRR